MWSRLSAWVWGWFAVEPSAVIAAEETDTYGAWCEQIRRARADYMAKAEQFAIASWAATKTGPPYELLSEALALEMRAIDCRLRYYRARAAEARARDFADG